MRNMKDSGIEWIGEIPENWEVKPIKQILCERKESNNPIKSDFILSLTNDRGVIPYHTKGDVGNKSKEDITGYKLVYPNDIVLNSMNVVIGSVGLSNYFGLVSPVYYMLYTRNKKDNIKYFNYIFQSKEFQGKLKGYGNGIMDIRMRIPMSKLNTVLIPLPSEDEQTLIADYLDNKVNEIDNIISKTQETIEEYKKYKQSVITEAVTKGLNPNVEMKDSGIEWIGKIPKHWRIVKMRYLGELDSAGVDKKIRDNEPLYKSIHYTNVYKGSLSEIGNCDNYLVISSSKEKALRCMLRKGDVLFTNSSETPDDMGHSTVIKEDLTDTLFGYHLMRFRPKVNICLKYEKYLFGAKYMRTWFEYCSNGITRFGINRDVFTNALVLLPPLEEQQAIANYLDKKCNEINNLTAKKQELITQLEKYKKSLIYECVTGKKAVVQMAYTY